MIAAESIAGIGGLTDEQRMVAAFSAGLYCRPDGA